MCGPHSLQSLNHTSPEDSEGTWEGLGLLRGRLCQTSVWKLYWSLSVCVVSAWCVSVCVCVEVVRRLWRRPGEISGRGNDRADKDNGRICTLPNKTCAPGIMQIPPSILTSVNIKRRRRRRGVICLQIMGLCDFLRDNYWQELILLMTVKLSGGWQ